MAENIDLMAFAKGAELANQANWQDTLNDLRTRMGENQLSQSQAAFGLQMPLREEQTMSQLQQLQGNRQAGETIASIVGQAGTMGTPEEQNAFILKNLQDQFATMGQQPGDRFKMEALQRYALDRAGMAAKAGDAAMAAQYSAMIPGNPFANQTRLLQEISDPRVATDPIRLQQLGAEGVDLQQGTVTYRGQTYPVQRFLQEKRGEAAGGLAYNPFEGINKIAEMNVRNAAALSTNPGYAERGYQWVTDIYGNRSLAPIAAGAQMVGMPPVGVAGPVPMMNAAPVAYGNVIPGLEQYVRPMQTMQPVQPVRQGYGWDSAPAQLGYSDPTGAGDAMAILNSLVAQQQALRAADATGAARATGNWITGGAR